MSRPELRIGSLTLTPGVPALAGSLRSAIDADALQALVERGLDLVELRVDLFEDTTLESLVDATRRAASVVPTLVTVRWASQGGAFRGEEEERLELYRALCPATHAIDVETEAPIRDAVLNEARSRGRPVILSFHDFEGTPELGVLHRCVDRALSAGGDVAKVATEVRSDTDTRILVRLLLERPNDPLIVLGMGEHGKKTRIFLPALGSLITFAAIAEATAPGQLDLGESAAELSRFYPEYRARRLFPGPPG